MFLTEPGTMCLVLVFGILSLPYLWRARLKHPAEPWVSLTVATWAARGLGLAFCVAAMTWGILGDVTMQLRAAPLMLAGAIAVPVGSLLGRLAVGPTAMDLPPERLRYYWLMTRQVAAYLLCSAVLFYAWRHARVS
ncbi:MAG: hypothetical protein ACREF4_06585 [Gammaproteobacteria bacterium]